MVKTNYICGKQIYICSNLFTYVVGLFLHLICVDFYICGQFYIYVGGFEFLWEFLHLMVKQRTTGNRAKTSTE